MSVTVANVKNSLSYIPINSSPYTIYWESNLAFYNYTTVFGSIFNETHTGTIESFAL